jgi:hypothetical protein
MTRSRSAVYPQERELNGPLTFAQLKAAVEHFAAQNVPDHATLSQRQVIAIWSPSEEATSDGT